jgi:hypothetical protein
VLAGGELVVEGAGRVLEGADEEIVQEGPVLERRLVQRLSPAPAADEVEEAVDAAEALDEGGAPAAGRVLVEQVDRAPIPALGRQAKINGEGVECLLTALGPGDDRPFRRQPLGNHRAKAAADASDRNYPALKHADIFSGRRRKLFVRLFSVCCSWHDLLHGAASNEPTKARRHR